MSKNTPEANKKIGRPVCEFYTHFKNSTAYPEPIKPETYHRSAKKALPFGVKTSELSFSGNHPQTKAGSAPKTGNFYSPFHFNSNKGTIVYDQESLEQNDSEETPLPYDALLEWQKNLAKFAVSTLKNDHPKLKANHDNNYPCLLFAIENRGQEKNPEIWSKFVMRYVIAFANVLSAEAGFNLELVARSSFDCLRPSISPCGESVRISFGLSPKTYVALVCQAVGLAYRYLQEEYFSIAVDAKELRKKLNDYNKKRKLEGKNAVVIKDSVWKSLWVRGDAKGCSFATQLFRTATSSDALTRRISQAAIKTKGSLIDALQNQNLRNEILVTPLQTFFQSITLSNRQNMPTLSIDNTENLAVLKEKMPWLRDGVFCEEKDYQSLLQYYLTSLRAEKGTKDCLERARCIGEIFPVLERALWQRSHHLPETCEKDCSDGCGSDSDTEIESSPKNLSSTPIQLFAKKFITATGMRAIQMAYAVGKIYLHQKHRIDLSNIHQSAGLMYYETPESLDDFAIPLDNNPNILCNQKLANITFVDVNHCNASHAKHTDLFAAISAEDYLCVLDITSATRREIQQHLTELFKNKAKLTAIILVASGLKNQQAMSDSNPYGEIRIVARDRNTLEFLYDQLKKLEENAQYEHPKESHAIRKTFKELGFTISNTGIFKLKAAAEDNTLVFLITPS